jgi:hypothetical protein
VTNARNEHKSSEKLTPSINVKSTPYSLTVEIDINHSTAGNISFDAELRVPEPSVILLLGLGLMGLWGWRRKS